ncbi:MAG: prolipoprotein diacylglyceryl transferase [Thermoanaerobaculia bacterium]|nr:prolipoprotein diacylglyceryl transferase [Thermoanaerobaculia bacterium]
MIQLFDLITVRLNWHACFRIAGEVAILIFLIVCWRRKLLPVYWPGLLLLAVFFVLAGLAGARLFSLYEICLGRGVTPQWKLLFTDLKFGALRWYGSMLFYALLLPLVVRTLPPAHRWKFFDLFGLSTCLFIVFLKQGCQFAGDGCYGTPTMLPWGMCYEWGEKPSPVLVHPTPLYDGLFHLLFFLYLHRHWRRGAREGSTGLLFFAGSAIFCFFLEFVRANPSVAMGLTLAQWIYLAILPLCLLTACHLTSGAEYNHKLKISSTCY